MSGHTTRKVAGLFLSSAFVIAGCGGGGSGGSSSPAAASAPVTISAANAVQVSGTVYDSAVSLDGAGSGSNVLTGAVTQTGGGADIGGALVSILRSAQPLVASGQFSGVTGAVLSSSGTCTGGGNFSFSLDDVDNDSAISTGDTMSLTFSSCNEGGVVLNGGMALGGLVVSGDITSFPYTLQFTMQMNNLVATENGQSETLNGSLSFSESTTDGVASVGTLSGSSIQYTSGGVTATITGFQLNTTDDAATGAYTLDISATVSSPSMGGEANLVTDTQFQGIGTNNPFSGQATITGANNSRVTLLVIDSVNVRLQIDEDGDGVTDSTIDTTWDAL